MATATLRLGKVDKGCLPKKKKKFLEMYHPYMTSKLKNKLKFRDEADNLWRPFQEIQGQRIKAVQTFLKEAGFMPKSNIDGIYGYGTTSAVRLFQEYIRSVKGDKSIGVPDGVAGRKTLEAINEWKSTKDTTNFMSSWGAASKMPTPEYEEWLGLLEKGKQHYLSNQNTILQFTENYIRKSDTLKIQNWNASSSDVHLIGIRRNQDKAGSNKKNDDLFILLINGLVFYFWGSTDPNPQQATRTDIPFLIEGQHRYGFGWHNIGSYTKIYKALRPATTGVLVFRDRNANQYLDEEDVSKGIDHMPNPTINIHWSGIGEKNYSAGCQVIAGASYINPTGQLVDCRSFAAKNSYQISGQKTRGAYNVLTDLILTYAPVGTTSLLYTLTRDDTAFLSNDITLSKLQKVMDLLKTK